MYKKILVANDGSEGAFKALAAGLSLAKRRGGALHMVSVEELPRFPASIDEVIEEKDRANHRFSEVLDRAHKLAKLQRVKLETHVIAGHAVKSIVEFLKAGGYDLLVIGFLGHSSLYNRIIGGTADRLVDLAPCSVLVVK